LCQDKSGKIIWVLSSFATSSFTNKNYGKEYFVIYFLCLDANKVTKKNQGKPERSARFALPIATHSASLKCFSI
jgi:hypothetical protein